MTGVQTCALPIYLLETAGDAPIIRMLNGTLRLTDLPPRALEKLSQRKRVRERVRGSLDLIDDDEELL